MTLEALGVKGLAPKYGAGVLDQLFKAGREIVWLKVFPKTVLRFVLRNPRGEFYISTRGHAMALVNGKLYDTTERGPDGRHVESAFQVIRPKGRA